MAFEGESLIYVPTELYGGIPEGAGAGPVVPTSIEVTAIGDHVPSEFPAPVGYDIRLQLWGGGGGGGGANGAGANGGGGGGGSGYVVALVPRSVWITCSLLTVGAGGGAGIAGGNGTSGAPSALWDASEEPILRADQGGAGLSNGAHGGGGSYQNYSEEITVLASSEGTPGETGGVNDGGAGGANTGPAGGAGGAGGTGVSGAGVTGSLYGGGGGGGSETVGVGAAGRQGKIIITYVPA
jgi:hypothetical protein